MSTLHDQAIDPRHPVVGALRGNQSGIAMEVEQAEVEQAEVDAINEHLHAPMAFRSPDDHVLLTGPEAQQYRALQAAARNAAATAKAAQTAAGELRDAFQAFCAGVAPIRVAE